MNSAFTGMVSCEIFSMQALRFNVNEDGKVCVVEVKKSSNRRFTKSNRS